MEKAIEYSKRSVELHDSVSRKYPASNYYRYYLASSLFFHGNILARAGQVDAAETTLRRTLDYFEKLEKDYPSSQFFSGQTSWARDGLAGLYFDQREYAKAIEEYNVVESAPLSVNGRVEWREDGKGYDPAKLFRNHMGSLSYRNRGIAHLHLKHYDKAMEDLSTALTTVPFDSNNITWLDTALVETINDDTFKTGMLALADNLVEGREDKGTAFAIRGWMYSALNKHDKAKADFERAAATVSQSAAENNSIAWLLATCPDARPHYLQQAVKLSRKAVHLSPRDSNLWNTLAVCEYRAGNWQASITAVQKSIELGRTGNFINELFIAMAYWQSGQKELARRWYKRAIQSHAIPSVGIYRQFFAEAAELLSIKEEITTKK